MTRRQKETNRFARRVRRLALMLQEKMAARHRPVRKRRPPRDRAKREPALAASMPPKDRVDP